MDILMTASVPTLDHPFGIDAWALFEKAWTSVRDFQPQEFRFVPGVTPMSTIKETATLLVTYYVVVFGGRELMKLRKEPFQMSLLFKLHNLFLTLLSGSLLALFTEQLLPTLWRKGTFYAICNTNGGWTKELVTLYYLNYITKYIELLDTIFLVLKKKPLSKKSRLYRHYDKLTFLAFLHTYHHGATALLCYTQLIGLTPISWVPITLNLCVHVVMYWYYFQAARGVKIWWKKYITIMQIVQFVVDLGTPISSIFSLANPSRLRLLCNLHLLHLHLLAVGAEPWRVRR
jgi:fatty acid elongase 3